MSDDWTQATGGELGQFIRWSEEASNDKQAEKTEYLGKEFTGILVDREEDFAASGNAVYTVETEEHGKITFWETKILKQLLSEAVQKYGMPVKVKIECKGKQEPKNPGGNSYWNFNVQYTEAPMEEAGDDEVDVENVPF